MKTALQVPESWPELPEATTTDPVTVCIDHPHLRLSPGPIQKLVTQVVEQEKRVVKHLEVVLTGSEQMRRLNQTWKDADYDTDVLSFPLSETLGIDGIVYVNLDFAETHGQDYGASFIQEVGRYVVHGLLHLLGYKDDTPDAEKSMRKKEDQYLQSAGFIDT